MTGNSYRLTNRYILKMKLKFRDLGKLVQYRNRVFPQSVPSYRVANNKLMTAKISSDDVSCLEMNSFWNAEEKRRTDLANGGQPEFLSNIYKDHYRALYGLSPRQQQWIRTQLSSRALQKLDQGLALLDDWADIRIKVERMRKRAYLKNSYRIWMR